MSQKDNYYKEKLKLDRLGMTKIQRNQMSHNMKELTIGCYGSIFDVSCIPSEILEKLRLEAIEDSSITLKMNHDICTVDIGIFRVGCGMEELHTSYNLDSTSLVDFLNYLRGKPNLSIVDDNGMDYIM